MRLDRYKLYACMHIRVSFSVGGEGGVGGQI